MKRKKILLIFFTLLALVIGLQRMQLSDDRVYKENTFISDDIFGQRIDVSKLNGIVILHYWATWCKPCIVEFPLLLNFMKSVDKDVHLVAISSDKKAEDIHKFLKKYDIKDLKSTHFVIDDGKFQKQFIIKMLPTTLILGKDKRVIKRISGEVDWSNPDLTKIVNSLN